MKQKKYRKKTYCEHCYCTTQRVQTVYRIKLPTVTLCQHCLNCLSDVGFGIYYLTPHKRDIAEITLTLSGELQ